MKASEGIANAVSSTDEIGGIPTDELQRQLAEYESGLDSMRETAERTDEGNMGPDPAQGRLIDSTGKIREELKFRTGGGESLGRAIRATAPFAAQEAKSLQETIDQAIPASAEWKGTFGDQLFEGLGQLATIPAYSVPGLGEAVTFGQLYQEGYDDAMQTPGMTEERARQAAGAYVIGAAPLEVLTDRLIVGKAVKGLTGKVKIGELAKTFAQMGAAGGVSEGAQQAWLNAVASQLQKYDPERTLDKDVANSVLIGGLVSAIGGSGAQVVGGVSQRKEATPALAAVLPPFPPSQPATMTPVPERDTYKPKSRGEFKDFSQIPPPSQEGNTEASTQDEFERLIAEDVDRKRAEYEREEFEAEPPPLPRQPVEGDERFAPPVEPKAVP